MSSDLQQQTLRESISTDHSASVRRAQQISRGSHCLHYSKLLAPPPFEERHEAAKAKSAEESIDLGSLWQQAILSNEEKFSLGGSGGLSFIGAA